MARTIQIEVRNVYGNEMIYPVCADAMRFAKLTGKKTLSHADLSVIEGLGYEIFQDPALLKRA